MEADICTQHAARVQNVFADEGKKIKGELFKQSWT